MTTQQPAADSGRPESQSTPEVAEATGAATAANNDSTGQSRNGGSRKARRRSVYLFPAYGFTMALDIARQVEESGGGTLTEETLAVNLGLSKNSSGFRLKCLAARQFNLLNKQGVTVSTTSIAKAILKPTSNEDALRGYRQSFLSIPLFQAVAERYRGQRLPDSQTLRNVLEREFMVEHKRVQQAERLLLDSARDTYLLKHRRRWHILDHFGQSIGSVGRAGASYGFGARDARGNLFPVSGAGRNIPPVPAASRLLVSSQHNHIQLRRNRPVTRGRIRDCLASLRYIGQSSWSPQQGGPGT